MVVLSALPPEEVRSFFEDQAYYGVGRGRLPIAQPETPSYLFEGGIGVTIRFLDDPGVPTKAEVRLYDPGHPEGYDMRCT